MSSDSVFLVYCELSGESPPLREEGFAGAFVTCLVLTEDISDAIQEARQILREDGYVIVDIDKALRFEPHEWTHDEDISTLADQVAKSAESAYSNFDVWGH
ncbi:MAG: hypothetical protein AAFR64_07710 [Pseudomonadota bacterium]